jgi:hypothetical protein
MGKNEVSTIEVTREEAAAVITQELHGGFLAVFNPDESKFWTSLKNDTLADKAQILNAMQNPDFKLADIQGSKVIMAKDILAHSVQLSDMNTGEMFIADRIVIICPNGQTVAGVSKGFKAGITNIFNIFGTPDKWNEPLPLFLRQVSTKKGHTYNINVLYDSKLDKIGL